MASFAVQMDGIRDYTLTLTVNQTSQNISNNTSTVSWSLVASGTWGSYGSYSTSYSVNIGGQVYSGSIPSFDPNPSQTIRSGSTTITHNANGTKTISVSGFWDSRHSNIGKGTASGSLTLTTIPRASTSSWATSGTKYAGQTYQINTNRASSGFTHTLTYTFGNASGTIATGVGASTNWTIPMSLLNQIPNSPSGTGTIITKTYSGGSLIGTKNTSITITAPTDVIPTWTSVTASEGNPDVTTKVGAGVYVQGVSKVSYAINGAAGVYSSTITQQRFTIAGQTVDGATGTTPLPVESSGTVSGTFSITDSRTRKKTESVNLTFLPYSTPTIISATATRALSDGTAAPDSGTYLKVAVNASVQSLVNGTEKNSIKIQVRARLRGSTTPWTDPTTLKHTLTPGGLTYNSSFVVSGPFAVDDSYEVRTEVIDIFNTSAANNSVPVAAVFMHWDGSLGVGIGKYREQGRLDVAGDIYSSTAVRAPGLYQNGRKTLSLQEIVYFTSSGTFTKANYPWLQAVRVRLVGGGGAGGSVPGAPSGTHTTASGGGGGGYGESFIQVDSLPTSVPIAVGDGGTAVANSKGNDGGSSSFGSLVVATGGEGGSPYPSSSSNFIVGDAGPGGYMQTGDFGIPGEPGQPGGGMSTLGLGGGGGGSYLGAGARCNYTPSSSSSVSGFGGRTWGGGGGGAASNASGVSRMGGNGAPGIVIIELYA